MLTLRQYQQDAVKAFFGGVKSGNLSGIIAAPTGSGKSLCIADICKTMITKWPHTRVIVATHKKELIEQDEAEFKKYYPHASTGIYSAGLNQRCTSKSVCFVGIQSVAAVLPASKLMRVRVNGHFVPNTLPDLSVDVLNTYVRYAEDAYRIAIKSVEEDLEFMRKQCSELRHYTRCQIKDFTKHTPAEIETMLNKMNINDRGVLNACNDLRSGRDRVMGIIRLNDLFRICGDDNYAIRTCNSFCKDFYDGATYAENGAFGYCSKKKCLIHSFEKCNDYMRNNERSDEFSDGC